MRFQSVEGCSAVSVAMYLYFLRGQDRVLHEIMKSEGLPQDAAPEARQTLRIPKSIVRHRRQGLMCIYSQD